MAKLTDVKTLDMQGGKVTRVSYAGAEYVRTEDRAVAGDIVQRRHKYDTEYATGGEFYLAYNTGGMRVYDNDDDVEYHTEAWRTFRKQAANPTPDLTQRVDAIDARVSALEGAGPAPAPTFKPGDYAKVARDVNEHRAGDIVRITEREDSRIFDFRIDRLAHNDYGDISAHNLEPATDAEVAQAKRAAKFTALGREVDEYRAGDIVEVVSGGIYDAGSIGVVTKVYSRHSFRVEVGGQTSANWHGYINVKLLAPVEARVDAQ